MLSRKKSFGRPLVLGLLGVGAVAIVGLTASPRLAFGTAAGGFGEDWNSFVPVPAGSWNNFEVTFAGDQTANISNSSYSGTNPFIGGTVSASFDSNTNATTVTYAGSSGTYGQSSTWGNYAVINGVATSHFGLIGVPGSPWLTPTSETWTDNSNTSSSLPSAPQVVPTWNPTSLGTGVQFLMVFLQSTDPGTTIGQWYEMPYSANFTASVTVTNPGSGTDTFSNFGYFMSDTQIPLDSLNFGSEPPPGTSGSPFTPLPNPAPLSAGQSETVGTPEPGALALLGLGLGALALLQKSRRKAEFRT